jgi:hypothetical protein
VKLFAQLYVEASAMRFKEPIPPCFFLKQERNFLEKDSKFEKGHSTAADQQNNVEC